MAETRVHLLLGGQAVCNIHGPPSDWPPGNTWVPHQARGRVLVKDLCSGCAAGLDVAPSAQVVPLRPDPGPPWRHEPKRFRPPTVTLERDLVEDVIRDLRAACYESPETGDEWARAYLVLDVADRLERALNEASRGR